MNNLKLATIATVFGLTVCIGLQAVPLLFEVYPHLISHDHNGEKFKENVNNKIDELDNKIDDLKSEMNKSGRKLNATYRKDLKHLDVSRKRLKGKLSTLKVNSKSHRQAFTIDIESESKKFQTEVYSFVTNAAY